MTDLVTVIIFSLLGSMVSLTGGILLMFNRHSDKWAKYATAFAAGALLAATFVDLLPEAFETGDIQTVSLSIFVGILLFFILEGTLHWFHRHRHHNERKPTDPVVPLVIIGDIVHNFIDGVAIATGFLVSPSVGIIVTLAVAVHEIPRKIGDFGLLLNKGVRRSKVLLLNVASAATTTIGAVIFYLVGQQNDLEVAPILGLVAGFFIYVAVSDIIPSIHHEKSHISIIRDSIILIIGAAVVSTVIYLLHNLLGST